MTHYDFPDEHDALMMSLLSLADIEGEGLILLILT